MKKDEERARSMDWGMRNTYNILVDKREEKGPLEIPIVDGRMILKRNVMKHCLNIWTAFVSGSGQGPAAECCEHGKESSGFSEEN
jgi:hypothetical protein